MTIKECLHDGLVWRSGKRITYPVSQGCENQLLSGGRSVMSISGNLVKTITKQTESNDYTYWNLEQPGVINTFTSLNCRWHQNHLSMRTRAVISTGEPKVTVATHAQELKGGQTVHWYGANKILCRLLTKHQTRSIREHRWREYRQQTKTLVVRPSRQTHWIRYEVHISCQSIYLDTIQSNQAVPTRRSPAILERTLWLSESPVWHQVKQLHWPWKLNQLVCWQGLRQHKITRLHNNLDKCLFAINFFEA